MLDEVDLWVDDMIIAFIDAHLEDYLNETSFEINVGLAYHHLSQFNSTYAPMNELLSTPFRPSAETLSSIYQNIILDRIYSENLDTHKALIEAENVDNVYSAITQLIGLMMTSSTSNKIDSLVSTLTSTTPEYMDADYAGMLLQALSFEALENQTGVATKIEDMLTYIASNITDEGMVAYGNANASSTAQVILGLVSQGLNPRGEAYTIEGVDLIEALKTFQIDEAFKYTLANNDADLAFSTPQAFAALVMYKIYRDSFSNPAVSLYHLE
jgi:hypothetical protein